MDISDPVDFLQMNMTALQAIGPRKKSTLAEKATVMFKVIFRFFFFYYSIYFLFLFFL